MKRRNCGVCGLAFSKGRRVELLEGGALRGVVVCQSCASKGITIIVADVEARVRAAAAPFARHLRKLAQGYALHDEKRAEGLRQAADILESGRLPPDVAQTKPNGKIAGPLVHVAAARLAGALATGATLPPAAIVSSKEAIRDFGGRQGTGHAHRLPRGQSGLSRIERRILTVLAQRPDPTSDAQILVLTGYRKTGSFTGALGSLRSAEFIAGPGSGNLITDAGRAELGPVEKLPRGLALLDHWKEKLGTCASAILSTLYETRREGRDLTESELLEVTGYRNTGSWTGAIGKLRKLNLVERRRLRIAETFFAAIEVAEGRQVLAMGDRS